MISFSVFREWPGWRRLGRDESGAGAVEFSLIAPILALLLLGIIEFAHIFLVQAEMTSAARQAVRRLALEAMTPAQTETFVERRMAGVTAAEMDVNVESTVLVSGQTDLTVQVSVPVTKVALFKMAGFLDDDSFVLAASGTMLKE